MASISHNSSLPGGIGCRKRIWKISIAVCYIHVLHTTLLARLLLHTGGNMHALQSSEPFLLPSWRKAHQCQFGQPSSSKELLFCTSKKITAMCRLMLSLSTCSSCQAKIIASETFVSRAKPHQLFQPNGNTKHRVNWTVEDKVDTNWKLSLTLRGFVCFKCHFPPLLQQNLSTEARCILQVLMKLCPSGIGALFIPLLNAALSHEHQL